MIERRDCRHEFQRFAQREDFSLLPLRRNVARENLPVILQRFHRRELQHVLRPTYLVARLAHAQTRLAADELCEFLRAFTKQRARLG